MLHLDTFLFIKDELFVFYLLQRHEKFLIVDLTVKGEFLSLVDIHHAIVLVLVTIEAESWELV